MSNVNDRRRRLPSRASDWRVAHAALVKLAARKAGYDAEEARWLVAGKTTGVQLGCGYGSYLEYLERTFGYSPRLSRERIRVAEALVRLPQMMGALAAGAVHWSAVRELTRVATPETEADWVAAASGRTLREVEAMVAGRIPGDPPGDMARPEERTHVLRLELKGPTYAVFRQVIEAVTRDAGHSLSDDEAVQLICDRALANPSAAAAANANANAAAAGDQGVGGDGERDRERAGEPQAGRARDAGRAVHLRCAGPGGAVPCGRFCALPRDRSALAARLGGCAVVALASYYSRGSKSSAEA